MGAYCTVVPIHGTCPQPANKMLVVLLGSLICGKWVSAHQGIPWSDIGYNGGYSFYDLDEPMYSEEEFDDCEGGNCIGKIITKPEDGSRDPASGNSPMNDRTKSSLLPAYCDPPNPCPKGYTKQDGCIEEFENKAEFSRVYQSSQSCMCDTEHMFTCPQGNMDMYGMKKRQEDNGDLPANPFEEESVNPYLEGFKLPIAAKKGFGY